MGFDGTALVSVEHQGGTDWRFHVSGRLPALLGGSFQTAPTWLTDCYLAGRGGGRT